MPGVKIVEEGAFSWCKALEDVECGELEIIGGHAFKLCESLRRINLLSVRIVDAYAFAVCKALVDVKFGNKLVRINDMCAFWDCTALERITIPLKDGLIVDDDIFMGCESLKHVDLIEGELHETIAAFQLGEWRNDMNEEIDSINRILSNARAGYFNADIEDDYDNGEKAQVIRRWMRSILRKIDHYKAKHQRILEEAATTLQLVLPRDTVMNNVLSFLELSSHTFEAREVGVGYNHYAWYSEESSSDVSSSDGSSSEGSSSEGSSSDVSSSDGSSSGGSSSDGSSSDGSSSDGSSTVQ